jgi:purine-binding chemotaxis protein CheW
VSESSGQALQYLTFALGEAMYAVDIRGIREIIEFGGLTDVPMMPPFVRGVISLRGAVVPVVDLNVRFGRAPTVPGRRTCIVIVEVACNDGLRELGMVVDAVSEVLEIGDAAIEPAPAFGARIRTDFIRGMALIDTDLIIVLDAGRVLGTDEMDRVASLASAQAESITAT